MLTIAHIACKHPGLSIHCCHHCCVARLAGEIVEKELAAHKEMVVELRRQLEEKESDLQVGEEGGRV